MLVIIATWKVMAAVLLIAGTIMWTDPTPCPRKYRVTQEQGGVLTYLGDIHKYCTLDYGGKFILKEE